MIKALLTAERGDAAARVARTCQRLGFKSLALRLPGEGDGVHLESCDEPVDVASTEPSVVARAGAAAGAEALHPGFASLDERLALQAAAVEAGLLYVGAPRASLERLASGLEALLAEAEVPASLARTIATGDALEAYAREYGFPLRLVDPYGNPSVLDDEEELEAAARRFAGESFTVQRWAFRPRLVRVVLIASGERIEPIADVEASLEASGQPLIEESPSPYLATHPDGDAMREALFERATQIARLLEWQGLLTVSFLLDPDTHATVQAIEPGMPVHHAGIEMTTGFDLVELELLAVQGQPLPEDLGERQPSGHAIGAWLVAPSTESFDEPASELRFPPFSQGRLRVEPSAVIDSSVPGVDQPRIAKVTVCMAIRHQAHLVLDRVLAETRIAPYRTNIKLLRRVLADESFRAGRYDCGFVTRLLTAPEARP